ncbi:MAG: hypothetical protein KAI43_01625 [Candidatus Aureabacteria bacterium]|nr:hypothetical protein [Candidatus Auribacterota bacterium]
MKRKFKLYLVLVMVLLIYSCATIDPIEQAGTSFPVPFARKYVDLFYTIEKTSDVEKFTDMIALENVENFDSDGFAEKVKKRSYRIGAEEKYELDVVQEIAPDENFRFIYFLKKEDFTFFSRRYRSIRIDRVICVKKTVGWRIFIPNLDDGKHYGIDTIYQGKVKNIVDLENTTDLFKDIVEKDFAMVKLLVFSDKNPDHTREEVIAELLGEGIRLYDTEKYREAVRLFKKAYSISGNSSGKAKTYIKRCQKAIEMGL